MPSRRHPYTENPLLPAPRRQGSRHRIMKLAELLGAEQIVLDMKAVDHWPAIIELVDHLMESGQLPPSQRDSVLDALRAREEQVSTGIGSGVAIPHAFSDELDKVVAVFGRSREGIEFEAIDNAPVHFVILFIVPRKDYHLHLRTLAAIAKLFTNSDVRRGLSKARTRSEVLEIIGSKPSESGTDPTPQPSTPVD